MNKLFTLFFVLLIFCTQVSISQTTTVSGFVYHASDSIPLPFVNVGLPNSSYGTITNSEGFFTLKIPHSPPSDSIQFSHLGFESDQLIIPPSETSIEVFLAPVSVELEEVVITPIPAEEVLTLMLKNIPVNYSQKEEFYEGAFTEWLSANQNGKLTEAAFRIHVPPHSGEISDKVGYARIKLLKGRKYDYIIEEEVKQLVHVGVGPHGAARKDVMHKIPLFFQPKRFKWFDYRIRNIEYIDDQSYYVIDFNPKQGKKKDLYAGTAYINTDNYALVRLDTYLPDQSKPHAGPGAAGKVFLKMMGINLSITEVTETIIYQNINGTYHYSYCLVNGYVSVKHKDKNKDYDLSITTELHLSPTPNENRVKYVDSTLYNGNGLEDATGKYDLAYWKDYQRIEPTSKLKETLEKIRKHSLTVLNKKDE